MGGGLTNRTMPCNAMPLDRRRRRETLRGRADHRASSVWLKVAQPAHVASITLLATADVRF